MNNLARPLEYQKELRISDREFIKEMTSEDPEWVKERRLEYLNGLLAEKRIKWKFWNEKVKIFFKSLNSDSTKLVKEHFCWLIEGIEIKGRDSIKKEAEKILKEIKMWNNPPTEWKPEKENMEEMIIEAKQVPVESLIQFNKAGFALCLWHDEKSPSLKWWKKENAAHCFGCNKTFDSISIVRQLYNYNFKEAVLFLTGK